MTDRVSPIARIRLARSLPRLLLVPAVLVIAGAASIAAGLLAVSGLLGIALAVLGAVLILGTAAATVVLLSVRLDVEESAVGITWMGGERIYPLAPGPVTRVRLRGSDASSLRARTGALGWGIGPARLRGEEAIEVVRLAPTRTAILVPTERGRLAIAAANDNQLLDALSRAAQARRRLEAIIQRVPEPEPVEEATDDEETERELTGIERALRERRLADGHTDGPVVPAPLSVPEPAVVGVPAVVPPAVPAGSPGTGQWTRSLLRRPRPRAAFVLLPMVGAGMAWGAGQSLGGMPEPGSDLARLTSLALVFAGPITSVGALMALAWWPRIVGVVVAGGLAASVFVGRALIGV